MMHNIPKAWWAGDSRVEKYMLPVMDAISRHLPTGQQATDIYNRAYEAVYKAIIDTEKSYQARKIIANREAGCEN